MATDYLPIEHDDEDTNRSTLAAHHQLGTDRYNASPGNHTHQEGDLNSIPAFDGITVEVDPNDLDSSVSKIWDILADYGVQVTVTPVPTFDCTDLNDDAINAGILVPGTDDPMDATWNPVTFTPPTATHTGPWFFVGSITTIILVSTGAGQIRVLSFEPVNPDDADNEFNDFPSDYADIPGAGIWKVEWYNLYNAPDGVQSITIEWTPSDVVTATCVNIESFE